MNNPKKSQRTLLHIGVNRRLNQGIGDREKRTLIKYMEKEAITRLPTSIFWKLWSQVIGELPNGRTDDTGDSICSGKPITSY